MVSTYGTTVKMLQKNFALWSEFFCGLILRKISINDKNDYKTVTKMPPTWSYLSITFLLELTVMKELVYLCMQHRSLPLKNSCEGVTDQ